MHDLEEFRWEIFIKNWTYFLIKEYASLNIEGLYVYIREHAHTHHWHLAALVVIPNSEVFHKLYLKEI